jgi:hypothetical protein
VNDEPNKTKVDPDLDSGWELGDEDDAASERPTLAPPFDLETYARDAMSAPSASRAVPPAEPTPLPVGSMAPPRLSMLPKMDPVKPNRVISLPPPPPLPARAPLPPVSSALRAPPDERSAPSAPVTPITPFPSAPDLGASAEGSGISGFSGVLTPVPPSEPLAQSAPVAHLAPLDPVTQNSPSEPPSQRITPREMQALNAALALSRETDGDGAKDGKKTSPPPEDAEQAARGDTLLAMANLRAPLVTPPRVAAVSAPSPTPVPAVAAAPTIADPVTEMHERFSLGDYSGALVMAESMLDENPTHVEAREYADSCRSVLQQMYTARIGPLDRIPVVDIARDQLRWLSIDHRTGFILSLVDGISSLEMILDVSGMPPLDALRMLFELVQQRIISIRDA